MSISTGLRMAVNYKINKQIKLSRGEKKKILNLSIMSGNKAVFPNYHEDYPVQRDFEKMQTLWKDINEVTANF